MSAPNLHPPKLGVTQKTQFSKLAPGDFMGANFKNEGIRSPMVGQSGPLILDHNLQPVWFDPIGVNALAANLTAQSYNGKPVLSWWQGSVSPDRSHDQRRGRRRRPALPAGRDPQGRGRLGPSPSTR